MARLFAFGNLLFPSRKTAPKMAVGADRALKRVRCVETACQRTVGGLEAAAAECDRLHELSLEVPKVSILKEATRGRAVRAPVAAAFSFAILVAFRLLDLAGSTTPARR